MKVAIAEDSVILRDGLVALLERRGHEIVVHAGDGDELVREYRGLESAGDRPDLVVADVRMPPSHTDEGLRAVLDIRGIRPGQPVLLFSQWVETTYASRLLRDDPAGVGYLLKDRVTDVADFLSSLERVVGGQTVLDPEVVAQLMGHPPRPEDLPDGAGGAASAGRMSGDEAGGPFSGRGGAGASGAGTVGGSSGVAGAGARSGGSAGADRRSGSALSPSARAGLERLTPREREVLALMATGRGNAAIAEELVVGYGAVEKYVAQIFRKLDLPPDTPDHRRVRAVLTYLEGRE
ncbi:response regulator transcription factor [Brevibacterium litoralis]|uniref:response regulator transcription factor n=1 Tax=Brevibacterium litoralis TaxID=3138935 RepID=UPI0032EEBFF9